MVNELYVVLRTDHENESFQYIDNTGDGAPLEEPVFVAVSSVEAEKWISEQPDTLQYHATNPTKTGRYSYDIQPVQCSERITVYLQPEQRV